MFIITGASGFIGAQVAGRLLHNDHAVVLCDHVALNQRPQLAFRDLLLQQKFVFADNLLDWLKTNGHQVSGVVHLGAVSDTRAKAGDDLEYNNVTFSVLLWQFCCLRQIPFVYASSASTYGDGAEGYEDQQDIAYHRSLKPLNAYGRTKHAVDLAILGDVAVQKISSRWLGLKFFNVYGGGELHKGSQRSVASQMLEKLPNIDELQLFKSYQDDVADGEQMRDFVWIDDCVQAVWSGLFSDIRSGIYNCGSGRARSFLDLARQCFAVNGLSPSIKFIDMPEDIRDHYQYYTQAPMQRSFDAGLVSETTSLETGVAALKEYLTMHETKETL